LEAYFFMTCSIPDCDKLAERSGKCATHARLERKASEEAAKPKKQAKPIDKVGKKNLFECSDGEKVTQADINSLKDKMYHVYDAIQTDPDCEGCRLEQAQGHAHIIPQARCKNLNKTELIWTMLNIFKACHSCNTIAENISSPAIMQLKNGFRAFH
jgi:hypothetical protein